MLEKLHGIVTGAFNNKQNELTIGDLGILDRIKTVVAGDPTQESVYAPMIPLVEGLASVNLADFFGMSQWFGTKVNQRGEQEVAKLSLMDAFPQLNPDVVATEPVATTVEPQPTSETTTEQTESVVSPIQREDLEVEQ